MKHSKKRLALSALIVFVGCSPNVKETRTSPPAAALFSSSPAAPPPTQASSAIAVSALPLEPPAPGSSSLEGPVYVLVSHSGVLAIDESGATVAKPISEATSPWNTGLVTGPNGEFYTSEWSGVSLIAPGAGAPRILRAVKDGPLYEHLAVRSAQDIWAVTSDSEWELVHYDGKTWTTAAKRSQFSGKYDDNKFTSLKLTADGVWVSTWNGLWQGVGKAWKKIEPPGEQSTIVPLFVYRDKLVAQYDSGMYLREGGLWRKLGVSDRLGHIWALSDTGLVAGGGSDNHQVFLTTLEGKNGVIESRTLKGAVIRDIAIDERGRVWVATDFALLVLDSSGKVLKEWTAGTLDGLVGDVWKIVINGKGPLRLPEAKTPRRLVITGRLVTYKSSTPLDGVSLELCASPSEERGCQGAPFARNVKTQKDGSFRFEDVPDGDYRVHLPSLKGVPDCEGIFRIKGFSVSPARHCKGKTNAASVCDLGTLTQCLPFEMPPPR